MKLLEEKKIKISGTEYPLRMSYRAMIEFETISGHSISTLESIKDVTILFYCTLRAGGSDMTYEQFMDLIDNQLGIVNEFSALMAVNEEKKPAGQ